MIVPQQARGEEILDKINTHRPPSQSHESAAMASTTGTQYVYIATTPPSGSARNSQSRLAGSGQNNQPDCTGYFLTATKSTCHQLQPSDCLKCNGDIIPATSNATPTATKRLPHILHSRFITSCHFYKQRATQYLELTSNILRHVQKIFVA